MIRIFNYRHPMVYLLFLILAFIFRIPSFHQNAISQDEALLLSASERIIQGSALYADVLTDDPPLTIGLYTLFKYLLGTHGFLAIRIFTCIYLFLCALIFNQFVNDIKLYRKRNLLPGFWLLLATSSPWYGQEITGELLVLLPILLSIYLLVKIFEEGTDPLSSLLFVGIFTSIAFLLNYQAIIFYFSIPLIYFILRPARLSEVFTLCTGFLIPLAITSTLFYFSHTLLAWWDLSVLYHLDRVLNKELEFSYLIHEGRKIETFIFYLAILLPLTGGFLAFRLGRIRLNIQQRKIESVMFVWLFSAILILILTGIFRHPNPHLILLFPASFYIYRFFIENIKPWVSHVLFSLMFLIPILSFFQYYALYNTVDLPKYFTGNDPEWAMSLERRVKPASSKTKLLKHLTGGVDSASKPSVWIAGNQPSVYYYNQLFCGIHYVDFTLFANKAEFLSRNKYRNLISKEITLQEVYIAFETSPPEWVADYEGVFAELKEHLPVLLASYTVYARSEDFILYRKKNKYP